MVVQIAKLCRINPWTWPAFGSAAGVSEAVRTVRKMEQSSLSVVAFGRAKPAEY
jgi:hypothetical protein